MADDQFTNIPKQPTTNEQVGMMAKHLLGEALPFTKIAPPEHPNMTPNAGGKIETADPWGTSAPYAQAATDMAGWLGPEMAAKGGSLAALHLAPYYRQMAINPLLKDAELASYKLTNDLGAHVADMNTKYHAPSKELKINWIGSPGAEEAEDPLMRNFANKIGPSDIRSVVAALKGEYPEMETITGERISGARHGPATSGSNLGMPVTKAKMKVRRGETTGD
jgi:hypothetical protein